MARKVLCLSLAGAAIPVVCSFFLTFTKAAALKPLRKAELLALVAGQVVDTHIIAEMRLRGLDFMPDEKYKSLDQMANTERFSSTQAFNFVGTAFRSRRPRSTMALFQLC